MSDKNQLNSSLAGRRLKRTPLFVVFITLLLVAVIVLSSCQRPRTPSEELIAAMKKTYDSATFEASADFSFNMVFEIENPEDQAISEIFNNITLNFLQKCDQKDLRYQLDLNILYKGQNCGSFILYSDLEKIALQSPLLSQRPICFNWEDSAALTSKYLDGVQIHTADYFHLIFGEELLFFKQLQEASYAAYSVFLKDRVTVNRKKVPITLVEEEKEKTYTCKEYIVNLDNDGDLQKDYQEFLVALLENETIRALLKEKIEGFVEIAKNNGDLETWPWTEDEIRAFAGNLDTHLNQLVDIFVKEDGPFEVAPTLSNQMETNYKISIDKSGIIRNIFISQTLRPNEEESAVPEDISFTIDTHMFNFEKQQAFTELDPAGAFDAGKASEAEWTALKEEVTINLIGQLMMNPLVQDIMVLSGIGGASNSIP